MTQREAAGQQNGTSDEIECIGAFRDKINRVKPEHREGRINGETSNRGNKLKEGAERVHRDAVNGLNNDIEAVDVVSYERVSNELKQKKRRRRIDTYNYEDGLYEYEVYEDDEFDSDENPYNEINIQEILAPISNQTDLVTRSSISKTYTNKILIKLAQQTIETIEKEQEHVNKLSSLLDLLLGEDSSLLLESELQLPDITKTEIAAPHQSATDPADHDEDMVSPEEKRITRRRSTHETDAFFALPALKIDMNCGLKPELAEEARQLSQVAVQRNQEYIRSLSSIRNGIVRAQKLKETLYAWAREMNGDPDEADLYQKEKDAAAAAAATAPASATSTNNKQK